MSIGETSTIINLLDEEKIEFMFNDELFNILKNVYENDFWITRLKT